VRADDDARDDVAEHYRLLEAVENHRHQAGHNHHRREVLKKGGGVHRFEVALFCVVRITGEKNARRTDAGIGLFAPRALRQMTSLSRRLLLPCLFHCFLVFVSSTYSARVMFFENTHAGSWSGGGQAGLLNGLITNNAD